MGIAEIMGVQHLMVIISKQEVACLPHRHTASDDAETPASIYELQEIELIPFHEVSSAIYSRPLGAASKEVQQSIEYQMNSMREGIKKFLECGFYVASHGFDITSNA